MEPLLASQIIEKLQEFIEKNGDGPVFSFADWEYITEIYWDDAAEYGAMVGPGIVVE